MRTIYSFIFLVLFSLASFSQPKHEVRAVWLTTIGGIDWPHSYAQSANSMEKQKNEFRQILDKLQTANINTVLLQTRIRGTLIYPSSIEPWDGCLSGFPGKSPGYDALQFAIEECHKRGMELHAWIVTMPVGKWDGLGCRMLRQKMPGNIIRIKSDGFMNPESTQTATYLSNLCAEVTQRYDIDGIHLDYIRYPEEWPKLKSVSREFGRENITRIVRAVSSRVKSIKPWVKMSCSPIGKYDDTSRYWSHGWNAHTTVCQDAVAWLRDGLMDEIFPMMYFRDNNFFPFALDWKEHSHGRIVVPGLGIYFMSPRERDWPLTDITRELYFLRDNGMGHAFFRSKFFTDNTKGIYSFAANDYCQYPSLVPPMTWASDKRPEMPHSLSRAESHTGSTLLTWQHPSTDTTMIMFNVYASDEYPVNTNDARNLVAIRRQQRHITIPGDCMLHYAVTATDRFGNESMPLQEKCDKNANNCYPASYTQKLACDGTFLKLPNCVSQTDAEYLIVESLEGGTVAILPYSSRFGNVNIRNMENGVYMLRSLNRKGISHRLGVFFIKR